MLKQIFFKKRWSTPKFMKQNSDKQLHVVFSGTCFLSKDFALLMMWSRHLIRPSGPHYKKCGKQWEHISETPPNQSDYPWFSKCTLNLNLVKPMLINSADISHLPSFSHWSKESLESRKSFSLGENSCFLTLFRMGGDKASPPPSTSLSSVTSTNVGISP